MAPDNNVVHVFASPLSGDHRVRTLAILHLEHGGGNTIVKRPMKVGYKCYRANLAMDALRCPPIKELLYPHVGGRLDLKIAPTFVRIEIARECSRDIAGACIMPDLLLI